MYITNLEDIFLRAHLPHLKLRKYIKKIKESWPMLSENATIV